MSTCEVPDPLPLRNIPVPAEVTRVAGCDCGGLQWHRDTCSLWDLPHEVAIAAVDAAEDSLREYTAQVRLSANCLNCYDSSRKRRTPPAVAGGVRSAG